MIERDDHDVMRHTGVLDGVHDGLLDPGVGQGQVLDLDGHPDLSLGHCEHLVERGDPFALESRIFPASGVESLELGHRVIPHQAAAVGRSVEQMIMDDRKAAVLGAVHVELDYIDTQLDRGPERR